MYFDFVCLLEPLLPIRHRLEESPKPSIEHRKYNLPSCDVFGGSDVFRSIIVTIATLALGSAAIAADFASIKSAPVPVTMWTGLYAGLNAGGTWVNNNTLNTSTQLIYPNQTTAGLYTAKVLSGPRYLSNSLGFIGGGQIGYNWQIPFGGTGFVSGIEADIQGIAGSGSTGSRVTAASPDDFKDPVNLLSIQQGKANLQYIGTVRGRLGYLVMPTLLVYGTGGLAYGGVSVSMTNFQSWVDGDGEDKSAVIAGSGSYANTQVGWTAGGGLEWMFLPNWSAKVEYLYYDLGRVSGSFANTWSGIGGDYAGINDLESITNFSARASGNIVRAGVNYHFNWGAAPVVAKY